MAKIATTKPKQLQNLAAGEVSEGVDVVEEPLRVASPPMDLKVEVEVMVSEVAKKLNPSMRLLLKTLTKKLGSLPILRKN